MYVDPSQLDAVKKAQAKFMPPGFRPDVIPVDKDYGFVPTDVSQKGKSGAENLKMTHELNAKRFGHSGY